jgi:hypothetical protein
VRYESGNVIQRRRVSTEWPRVRAFFAEVAERSAGDGGYLAIVEICGFNHWLLRLLTAHEGRCHPALGGDLGSREAAQIRTPLLATPRGHPVRRYADEQC